MPGWTAWKLSVKPTPVRESLLFGLLMVMVRVLNSDSLIGLGEKLLPVSGGSRAVRVSMATELELVPASKVVRKPLVLVSEPETLSSTVAVTVQAPGPAGIVVYGLA